MCGFVELTVHCLSSFVIKSCQSGSRRKDFKPTRFVVASKGIQRESSIEFLVKLQSRPETPPEQDSKKKALASVNGHLVITERRGLNR